MSNQPVAYSYHNTGSDWMGKIPDHWQLLPVKRFFRLVAEPAESDNDHELLSIYTDIGVRPRKELEQKGNRASTTDGYWLVKKGDLIVNKLLAWMGAIGMSNYDGVTSPAYDILRQTKPLEPKFFHYLFRCGICFTEFRKYSRGIMDMRLRLYFDELGKIPMPFPPVDEQNQIAAFLDYETAKIDELIEKQQQLIALLGEKRQAVISHAVTKGLNPDAPMRDSGFEWLGEVPEHWTVVPFRHVFDVAGGQVDPRGAPYAEMPLIAPNHIESGTGRLLSIESTYDQGAISGKYLVGAGDIIYSKIRPSLRKVVLAPENCLCSADMYALRLKDGGSSAFFTWFLLSEYFSDIVALESMRVAMPKANRESLAPIPVPVPPPNEQVDIAEYIDQRTQRLDDLESKANHQVELLQERRTALISAAVTGKIDVRGWKPPSSDAKQETEMEVE